MYMTCKDDVYDDFPLNSGKMIILLTINILLLDSLTKPLPILFVFLSLHITYIFLVSREFSQ